MNEHWCKYIPLFTLIVLMFYEHTFLKEHNLKKLFFRYQQFYAQLFHISKWLIFKNSAPSLMFSTRVFHRGIVENFVFWIRWFYWFSAFQNNFPTKVIHRFCGLFTAYPHPIIFRKNHFFKNTLSFCILYFLTNKYTLL